MREPPKKQHWTKTLADITNMTGSIAVSIGLCTWMGYQAGELWGYQVAFIFLGLLIGLAGASVSLSRFLKKYKDM